MGMTINEAAAVYRLLHWLGVPRPGEKPTAEQVGDDLALLGARAGKTLQMLMTPAEVHEAWQRHIGRTGDGYTDLDAAMATVYHHGQWRLLTSRMTLDEREAAADAVRRWEAGAVDDSEPRIAEDQLRWWLR